MKNLESITLSNIRRFGNDITLELGSGATILLAPNGTGKTAIFEAIEFGLTGKISRLGGNLSPIIRDSQTMARVSLNFGDVQASAQVSSNGDVQREGDLSSLFPDIPSEDIPFLLRLTHLLDQREGEWLVKADSKVAGSQLARLPIGKDGDQVSSALGSIRRAVAEQLKQAKSTLTTLEAEFGEWQSLVLERDLADSQSQGVLRSKDIIAKSIADIAHKAQSFELLPPGLLESSPSQGGLETALVSLEQLVETKLDRLREQIAALAEVDGLIDKFISEQARSELLSNELVSARQDLVQKKQDRDKLAASHEKLQLELVDAESERNTITQQLNQHINKTKAKETVDQNKKLLDIADNKLNSAESEASCLRVEHEANEQLGIQHDLINKQRKSLVQISVDLITANQLMESWKQSLQRADDIKSLIKDEEKKEKVFQERLSVAISSKVSAETEELDAKSHYEFLNSAADSIRQAVASIAAHLPNNQGDCPLCGEEHGAEKLHERIKKALEAIDPNVVHAELRIKKATDALRECKEAVGLAEAELKACKEKVVELKSQYEALEADIRDFKSNTLLGGDTVSVAEESIRRREDVNASAMLQLDEKLQNLPFPLAQDICDRTKLAYESAISVLNSARQSRSEASSRLEQAFIALAVIDADTPATKSVEELSLDRSQNAKQINALTANIAAEQSAFDRQQAQFNDSANRVSNLETKLSDAQSRLATIRASWRQLSFLGDPVAEVVNNRESELQSSVTELVRHTEMLQTIKIEIGGWKKLEQVSLAQGVLDRRRGELSEDEFTIKLQQLIEEEQLSKKKLLLLSEAIDTFNQHLSSEIENVQKHVLAVVPRWQALLKRVVREWRFSDANLDFRSSYKKVHAGVSVPLNGAAVPVPSIASEAQLTDLQLTFLLSMALDHQWSSWRCLLLDDPTQHHDLVHASSVFDVLRDYVVDHGFQVVIATHDALQARYFMRKLQNDGIEARILSLVPTPDGVTVSESPWPSKG
ncbi:AAA family ATPase [Marinomonas lutimaris]|uniref:AAA family ATPase n=1 Tax=Marinomonas lutimaris TaxID=2846746 RepID=UPI001CA4CC78|nr:AAA family ATPase [Marinomonas lutimaris]